MRKIQTKKLDDGSPASSFRTLLRLLSNIVRNKCRSPGAASSDMTFDVTTSPDSKQRRAYELLKGYHRVDRSAYLPIGLCLWINTGCRFFWKGTSGSGHLGGCTADHLRTSVYRARGPIARWPALAGQLGSERESGLVDDVDRRW